MLSITAIICARNEWPYLRHLIPYLLEQSIQVHIIDNDSNDGTADYIKNFDGYVQMSHLPFKGYFCLTSQLEAKAAISSALEGWVIHQDADEILASEHLGWGGLRQVIEEAHAQGYDALNFRELVMLPEDPHSDNYLTNSRLCYFFAPYESRLHRAFKAGHADNKKSGGHRLEGGDLKLFPTSQVLKHFIVRSQSHAYDKYLGRTFSSDDLAKGWHGNRQRFTVNNLSIPVSSPHLEHLKDPKQALPQLPPAVRKHFWEW